MNNTPKVITDVVLNPDKPSCSDNVPVSSSTAMIIKATISEDNFPVISIISLKTNKDMVIQA